MPNTAKKAALVLLIATLSFLSYYSNFFRVTSDLLFTTHQLDSEQLVLDGILHGQGSDRLALGSYTRPGIDDQALQAHRLYAERNTGGDFVEYKSQFGLQLHVFAFLAATLGRDVRILQAVPALLMSLVVVLFFLVISREFSRRHALFFCIPLMISPWVVIFARNLYWVEATWFLPAVIVFYLGRKSFSSAAGAGLMGAVLFAAFLAKFLCGYEYMTTIGLSTCVPVAYYSVRYRFGFVRGLKQAVLCGVSLLLAFCVAAALHVGSLGEGTGGQQIVNLAKRRLSAQNPSVLADEASRNAKDPAACREEFLDKYGKSLTSNRIRVVLTYFTMPHFLPWVDCVSSELSPADKALLKGVRDRPAWDSVRKALEGVSFHCWSLGASLLASAASFLILTLLALRAALRRRDAVSLALLAAAAAPLSWFFLAKGHSYIHTHLNYVLWYLLYIPMTMLIFTPPPSPLEKEST